MTTTSYGYEITVHGLDVLLGTDLRNNTHYGLWDSTYGSHVVRGTDLPDQQVTDV